MQGTDREITLIEVAKSVLSGAQNAPRAGNRSVRKRHYPAAGPTYPNGCHVSEVEIDPETGVVEMISYTVVDDVGVALNPMMVKGQVHGGVVQGAGQVLLEQVVYDPESGQLLTGSFMDYAMPRADNFPSFDVIEHNVPSKNNPMGLKGAGEAGTVGALPAVMNAICDALAPSGYAISTCLPPRNGSGRPYKQQPKTRYSRSTTTENFPARRMKEWPVKKFTI